MEALAPPYEFCLELELRIELGDSVRAAAIGILKQSRTEFSFLVQELLAASERSESPLSSFNKAKSCYQKSLLQLLWRGLQGEPILAGLRMLKIEMESASKIELDEFMARLPLLALVPLLILLLPAFMILLFGPLLNLLSQGVLQ